MHSSNRQKARGFTLVELMIVVAIIGVLAALAIYGVTRYVANAKTTEARSAVARIAKDATTAYARPKMAGDVLAAGGTVTGSNVLCLSSTKVPADEADIKGRKYQSAAADWAPVDEDELTGWRCLQFSMTDPQMYQYEYTAVVDTSFEAIARGDLDADGDLSTFQLNGSVMPDESNALFVSPSIIETDPLE